MKNYTITVNGNVYDVTVEDVLTLGDKVKVVCLGKDKMGRISFSIKDVPENA